MTNIKKEETTIRFIENDEKFIFYNSEEGVKVRIKDETIWLNQKEISNLFDVNIPAVSKHISNIFNEGELEKNSTVSILEIVQEEGLRVVRRNKEFFNLDMIIAVGYRVNSYKATRFRKWATNVLKEYMIKGFILDKERLKQGENLFGKDYFEKLLEEIREIRASERRFYQKITDIYSKCSYDYDADSPITKNFFSHAQDKLEYAITGMTSAEIIKTRANHKLPYMGLKTWSNQKKSGKIIKNDIITGKNYLEKNEIDDLNRLVSMFLDYAENLAKKSKKMYMKDWATKLDDFLRFNEYQVLQDYGNIKRVLADKFAISEYDKFRPIQDKKFKSDFDKFIEKAKNIKTKQVGVKKKK